MENKVPFKLRGGFYGNNFGALREVENREFSYVEINNNPAQY